ncbi:MAG: hypothetical protein A3H71_02600 [Candidatus Sungbacteria bacterium RIFCSPLOWO2_02_FULL_48_13b]|uniref:Uncharacterized protein n=2 Tax=Candidatus Sungiibacteriota TaxID=1817917 RepID=A0A1G2LLM7_9BACT|nr:MAG: hypothetical protein A3C12_01930 [Candidatus Sungbacteria bacterium RIFCSPHIGHO2_02_FULL_49_20]OHA11759.1 MAG: hypothetical protein A3H71_02600 [Candidatus Sungbacteria bacterium RIFCSPLOWO2_02_FULL_48_13b]
MNDAFFDSELEGIAPRPIGRCYTSIEEAAADYADEVATFGLYGSHDDSNRVIEESHRDLSWEGRLGRR